MNENVVYFKAPHGKQRSMINPQEMALCTSPEILRSHNIQVEQKNEPVPNITTMFKFILNSFRSIVEILQLVMVRKVN